MSAALSRDGNSLYVTGIYLRHSRCGDLTGGNTHHVSLNANPEGVAVGADGRVLMTTVAANASNTLLIYDPAGNTNLVSVPVLPPAATPPVLPVPSGAGLRFLSQPPSGDA